MKSVLTVAITVCITLFAIVSNTSHADGLQDLKDALNRLQGENNITAVLSTSTLRNKGKGKKKKVTKGQVSVWLADSPEGLQVVYSNDILAKMEKEALDKAENEEAETMTLNAIDGINASELHSMLSASASLLRDIQQAEYLDEKLDIYNKHPARLLRFKLPMKYFISDKETRSYVKKFDATYHLWIDAQGNPLGSKMAFKGKGRAYIFFTMEATGAGFSTYKIVGNRLVNVHQESTFENDSTFGKYSGGKVIKLTVQPQDIQTVVNNSL